jgi:hypothetical protein
MTHIIFSTAEEHGLEKYDRLPRVTLRFDTAKGEWFIAWSYYNLHSSQPDRQEAVNAETAFAVLKSYLVDLWRETHAGEHLPAPLAGSE